MTISPERADEPADADIRIVLAAYAAFARADIDAAVADIAPDVDWIEPDEFPNGGWHVGRAAVWRYLAQSRAGWRELSSVPRAYRRGARIVVEHSLSGTLIDATRHEATVADIFTLVDGRIVHMQAYASPDLIPAPLAGQAAGE